MSGSEPTDDGRLRLWSVTTLLKKGLQANDPIVNWHCEQTATAAVEARETVNSMLRDRGPEATVKWLVSERWNVSERHKIRGTLIHKYAEAYALGTTPEPLPEQLAPYGEQLVRWWARWQPQFLQAEAPVYHVRRAYAGTLDGIATFPAFPERTFVIDYKTTPKGPEAKSRPPYPEVALQLCAYARAERVGLLADRQYTDRWERYYVFDPAKPTEPMPPVTDALCIVVSPFDCYAVPVSIGSKVWRTFLHVQALAEWHERGWRPAISAQRFDLREIPPAAAAKPKASRRKPPAAFGPDDVDVEASAIPRPPEAPPTRTEGEAA